MSLGKGWKGLRKEQNFRAVADFRDCLVKPFNFINEETGSLDFPKVTASKREDKSVYPGPG